MRSLSRLILSFGGLGELPIAPGTWGTAGAAAVAAALFHWAPTVRANWQLTCGIWVVAAFALTVLLTPDIEAEDGRKDPQVVVMDEVAGYWATLILVPEPTLAHLAAAFFVFRFLDVWKPWPASALEKLPAGWGVAADDVMAGFYGAVAMWAATRF